MRFNDAVIGVLCIIVAIAVIIHVQSYPDQPGGLPGPALFPEIMSVLLIIAGSVLVVSGIRSRAPLCAIMPQLDARGIGNILLSLIIVVFYVYVSDFLGFLLTSFAVMVGMMLMLKARLIPSILVAASNTVLIYVMFNKFLLVPLPRGLLAF